MASPKKNLQRIEAVRTLATEGLSASEIAVRLKCTRNAVMGLCKRNDIKLAATSGPRGTRPRPSQPKTMVKTGTLPLATHVVVTTDLKLPTGAVQCMWNGCKEPPIKPGKPYCSAHHVKSGGLF